MANITINLQDGFNGESVTISVNQRDVYCKQKVVTQKLLGFADEVVAENIEGDAEVRIVVKQAGSAAEYMFSIDAQKSQHVGISLEGRQLRHILSAKPFGYG